MAKQKAKNSNGANLGFKEKLWQAADKLLPNMDTIEKDNRSLKNILSKNYARQDLDKARLGELIDLIGTNGLGDLETQKEIAHILGTLDDKIELNRRMNKTLEEIAQTIYKHWFMDFEFPNENGNPYKCSGGKMVDSELGPIPKGWRVGKLEDFVEINPLRYIKKKTIAPYLDMSNMPIVGSFPNAWQNKEHISGTRFINGDTLIAKITPCLENGKTAYVNFLEKDQVEWGSSEFYVIRPKREIPSLFTYFLARSKDFRNYLINSMTGSSGRQRVPISSISNYLIPIPSFESTIFEQFNEQVTAKYEMVKESMLQNESLIMIKTKILKILLSPSS